MSLLRKRFLLHTTYTFVTQPEPKFARLLRNLTLWKLSNRSQYFVKRYTLMIHIFFANCYFDLQQDKVFAKYQVILQKYLQNRTEFSN